MSGSTLVLCGSSKVFVSLFLDPPSSGHKVCVIVAGPLHDSKTCFSWGCPILLVYPKCWGVLLQLDFRFTNRLSYALFQDSRPAIQFQDVDVLYDSIMPSKPVPLARILQYQVWIPVGGTTLTISGTQLLYADSEEMLPRKLHTSDSCLFLITVASLASAPEHLLCQQTKCFLYRFSCPINQSQFFSLC